MQLADTFLQSIHSTVCTLIGILTHHLPNAILSFLVTLYSTIIVQMSLNLKSRSCFIVPLEGVILLADGSCMSFIHEQSLFSIYLYFHIQAPLNRFLQCVYSVSLNVQNNLRTLSHIQLQQYSGVNQVL